ncbi:uncharacterized protein TM35_000901090 [Trypanosoma theileri]|uniref:Mucin-associated surface protein (MASP) n=1 Tax=Trypanosoma theileri TaxID=67003 RepID=A0A1X0NEH4_9TRYP|nr:uncharacterized protein TM35_000901090 [Trypanosoma theileri]ORC82511.1 hypothetical protein TM35_000901090 [Trypanosoma theileri]
MTVREMMRHVVCLLVLMVCCAYGCVSATQPSNEPQAERHKNMNDLQRRGEIEANLTQKGITPGVRVAGAVNQDSHPNRAVLQAGASSAEQHGPGTPGVDDVEGANNYKVHPGVGGVPPVNSDGVTRATQDQSQDSRAGSAHVEAGGRKALSTPHPSGIVPGFKNEETPAPGERLPLCPSFSNTSGNVIGGVPGKDGVTCAPGVPGSVSPLPSGPSPTSEEVNGNLSIIVNNVTHPNGTALESELKPAPTGAGLKPYVPPNASDPPHGSKFPGVSGAVPIVHNKPDTPEYPGVPAAALHVGNGSSEAGRVRFSRPVTQATDADSHSTTDSSDTASPQNGENNNQAETTAASSQSESIRNTPKTPTKVTPPAIPTILQPPLPAKTDTKPPKKSKADSSSMSSVWVRVTLLIMAVLFSATVY